MTFVKNNSVYIAIAIATFAIGLYLVLPMLQLTDTGSSVFVQTAEAVAPGGGDGGCCGGDDPDPDPPGGGGDDGEDFCDKNPTAQKCKPSVPTKCDFLTATPDTVPSGGGSVKLEWGTTNASIVEINNGVGSVSPDGTKTVNVTGATTFKLTAYVGPLAKQLGRGDSCTVSIEIEEPTPEPACLAFDADPTSLPNGGGSTKLTWSTENASKVELRNVATGTLINVAKNNSIGRNENITEDTTFRLKVTGADGTIDNSCIVSIDVEDPTPDPLCKSFSASPEVFNNGTGGDVTLNWETVNLASASINQGIGPVNLQGPINTILALSNVTAPVTTTYTLTGIAADGRQVTCSDDVVVNPKDQPNSVTCEANANFEATPTNLPAGGGDVTLKWSVDKVASVKLNGTAVALSDTKIENVTSNKTFTLEITGDSSTAGNTVLCPIPVTVDPPSNGISCANNASFTVSDSSVRPGDNVTLNWNVTGNVDTVSIDNGIGVVGKTGSRSVRIDDDTDFFLTIANANDSDQCPVSVSVSSGGGGGGSPSPKCEFLASDKSISAGEEITLSWETSRGKDITIYEGGTKKSDIIFETDDDDTVDEGDLKVRPREDTTYTLIVERGSRDRKCEVDIKVKDEVVIKSTRSQGQVQGISLTAVPYTGFEAGPALTMIFYTVLAIWALFVAYMLVIREDTVLGVSLAGAYPKRKVIREDLSSDEVADDSETSEAAAYVGSVIAPTAPLGSVSMPLKTATEPTSSIPSNLPTGDMPAVGYASAVTKAEVEETEVDAQSVEMKELEDRAHENHVLLSSDAMRHLIKVCPKNVNRVVFLEQIMAEAKISYPSEDGWIVLNLDRMQEVCEKRGATEVTANKVAVAEDKPVNVSEMTAAGGASSLAEAIVTGNIAAAYKMISSRPMLALADAAADLDAVYRARQGERTVVSDMLTREASNLTNEQIKAAIDALTSAIDGTYEDEAGAVKMAILKATKAVA